MQNIFSLPFSLTHTPILLCRVWVRLGELDTRTNLCSDGRVCSEPQDFEIESVVHHPGYDTPKYANDIALIRIRTAFTSG